MNAPQQRSPEGLRTTIIDGLSNKGWFGGVSHMFDEWVGALAFVLLPDGHADELTRGLAANVVVGSMRENIERVPIVGLLHLFALVPVKNY